MPRVRLNDNCHGKVLFILDSVKKNHPSCKLLKKLPENQVIKFIWPYRLRTYNPLTYSTCPAHSPTCHLIIRQI